MFLVHRVFLGDNTLGGRRQKMFRALFQVVMHLLMFSLQEIHAQSLSRNVCASPNYFSYVGALKCLKTAFNDTGKFISLEEQGFEAMLNASRCWASRIPQYAPIIVYPTTTADVVAAVTCAWYHGMPMSTVSGRHSFQAQGVQPNYMLIDVSTMCQSFEIDEEKKTVTMSAGCRHGYLLGSTLHLTDPESWMVTVGNCPLVGLGGYMLGGGQGDGTPYMGLFCDQLVSIEMVLYNGTVIVANSTSHRDVFWASCGGGGGLGVITTLTLQLTKAPAPGHFTRFEIFYPIETSSQALIRFQKMVNRRGRNLFGGNGVIGPGYYFGNGLILFLLYLGPYKEGIQQLTVAGLLSEDLYPNNLWLARPPNSIYSNYNSIDPDATIPTYASVRVYEYTTYQEAISSTFLQQGTGANMTRVCEILQCDFMQSVDLTNKTNAQTILGWTQNMGSPLLNLDSGLWLHGIDTSVPVPGYLTEGFTESVWADIVNISTNPKPNKDGTGTACREFYFILNHLSGGYVAQKNPKDTAYPWRQQSILFTYLLGVSQTQWEACSQVRQLYDTALHSYLQDSQKLYYNYLGPPTTRGWERLYFGDNYLRLQQIKSAYDPYNFFTKLMTPMAG